MNATFQLAKTCFPVVSAAVTALLAAALSPSHACAQEPSSDASVDFGRDVRALLSDNCFLCHGPAEETREADLRLDSRESAIESGAIDASALGESEILSRIFSDDPDLVMPPTDSGKALNAEQRQTIKRWVEQGAEYTEHWAFVTPVRPSVPQLSLNGANKWQQTPIDAFVLARNLKKTPHADSTSQLQSPRADKNAIARRLYLDLTGLPPSPDQLQQFLDDDRADATERLVDHLLESKHFGERWARWWLDAARYADSDGYEKDKPRSVWFYRDWVVGAMNDNMPYDQFIIEQIAGDLLPNPTQDQRVATGFLRNSMVNEEGGADPEQFRVEAMFDRMDAVGKAILGITTQCAQCHTHKYDPLNHLEYYQMYAALNDFHEASLTCFTPEQATKRDQVLGEIANLREEAKALAPNWPENFRSWQSKTFSALPRWTTLVPDDLPYEGQKFALLDDGSIVSESYAPTKVSNTFNIKTTANGIRAFRIDALKHPQLPRGGPGRSIFGTGALSEFEVSVAPADDPSKKRKLSFVRAYSDVNPPLSDLPSVYRDKDAANDKRTTGGVGFAIDSDMKTAWSTDNGPGRRNRDRVAIFVLEQPLADEGEIILSITLHQKHGGWNSDDNQNYLLGRYRFSVTRDPVGSSVLEAKQVDESPLHGLALGPAAENALMQPPSERSELAKAALLDSWVLHTSVQNGLGSAASDLYSRMRTTWTAFPETDSQLVVEAQSTPKETFVFLRGDFLQKGLLAQPATPAFLGPMGSSAEPARLQFARWLVRSDAPTTARVVVNRIWQAYFGRGIVATPEDFGLQSAPPSHPDLLDWLAVELVDSGWDLKHIHLLICNSATYQQSAIAPPSEYRDDPQNEMLRRGPRVRVDAEVVRDIALSVSGLLNPMIGGPSVYPPAPDFLFEPPTSYGPKVWSTEKDAQAYRRSLYVHQYRSVPYPVLQVFDAPKGDASCVRRQRSNTPLQALVMLNETQFAQCAQAFATRIIREGGNTDSSRLQYGFTLATSRQPDDEELAILQQQLDQHRSRMAKGDVDIAKLLGVDATAYQRLTGGSAPEAAAFMLLARTLLNLDETITK
ncbi:MAG: PSD1 and planctomycete cytochrome C domain-containing protein [Aureliella sp.]